MATRAVHGGDKSGGGDGSDDSDEGEELGGDKSGGGSQCSVTNV